MFGADAQQWNKRIRLFLRAPRRLRPTRAGWMFLLINLGVGFAALNTGNNLLYLVLSLLLAFLTLSGLLSESALRGIEIRRTLSSEIYAGTDNPVLLEVRNFQRKVPAFAIVVEDRCRSPRPDDVGIEDDWRLTSDRDLPVMGRVFALRVGPECTEVRTYALHPELRGELRFHSFRVSTRFPFGLFLKSRTIHAPDTALVFPEIEHMQTAPPISTVTARSAPSTWPCCSAPGARTPATPPTSTATATSMLSTSPNCSAIGGPASDAPDATLALVSMLNAPQP